MSLNNPTCSRFAILTYVISEITLSRQSSGIYFLESTKSISKSVQQYASQSSIIGRNITSRFKFNHPILYAISDWFSKDSNLLIAATIAASSLAPAWGAAVLL